MEDFPIEPLARRWAAAERVVVLTGAGLSTASGIPDFRSPGGRWEHYRPVTIQEFLASESSAEAYWKYKGETWDVIRQAQPNAAHRALAELALAGRIFLLATQNVDGLHERSGFPPESLINVHGTDSAVACQDCGARGPREPAQEQWRSGIPVPRCASCGGRLKPATISFGQSLVEADLRRASEAALSCELFVAAGTSLVVGPINQLFDLAAEAGAATAILTASDTPCDERADFRSRAPVERTLPAVAREVTVVSSRA